MSNSLWKLFTRSCALCGILSLCACAQVQQIFPLKQPVEQKPAPPVVEQKAPEHENDLTLKVDFLDTISKVEVHKVSFMSMKPGTRKSVQKGKDILRVGRYQEEMLLLPKMRASRDFHVKLNRSETPKELYGYSNVTYELLSAEHEFRTLLMGGFLGMVAADGRLSSTFYFPTDKDNEYQPVTGTITPKNVHFKRVRQTRVIPKTEKQYVLRYIGKEGMQLVFERRDLSGGSRPHVIKRKKIRVPLGETKATVSGHVFKIHTATPTLLDITLLK